MYNPFDMEREKKWIDQDIQASFVRAEMRSKRDGIPYEHQVIHELINDLVFFAKELSGNDGMPPSPHEHRMLEYRRERVEEQIRGMIAQVSV